MASGSNGDACPPFVSLAELERLAADRLSQQALQYYQGFSETGTAAADNAASFARFRLQPRVLVDVGKVDTSCTLFGYKASMPVLVAPMAMHGLAHAGKELATAAGAAAAGVPMAVSTMATTGLEELAAARRATEAGGDCLIFQLYVLRDRALTESHVRAAEAAGYRALVVTVDAPRLGRREADERSGFAPPPHLSLVNLLPLARREGAGQAHAAAQARGAGEGSGLFELFAREVDDTLTWEFVAWLRGVTRLPVYVKGVLAPEDALLAARHGCAGVIVSNHGGRQLDYAPAALDALPRIVAAVRAHHASGGGGGGAAGGGGGQQQWQRQRRLRVLMDGGVRRGTDVIKALALGADAVLVGRPVLYALAVGGAAGVERALRLLRAELELAMALAGVRSLAEVGPHMLLVRPNSALVPYVASGGSGSGSSCCCGAGGCCSAAAGGGQGGGCCEGCGTHQQRQRSRL